MRRAILMMLLAVVSNSAMADIWKCVGDSGIPVFVESETKDKSNYKNCTAFIHDEPLQAESSEDKKKELSHLNSRWVAVGGSDAFLGGITTYVDPATIRKNGNKVKMWILYDYKTVQVTPEGKTFLSEKMQNEFDCKEEQSRILALSEHSGNMGRDNVIFSGSDAQKWRPVSPESIGETVWKIACGK